MLVKQSDRAMKFRGSDIKKFQSLYLKHFDEVLSDDQALAELSQLIRQLEIVYQPIVVSQFEKYINKAAKEETSDVSFK